MTLPPKLLTQRAFDGIAAWLCICLLALGAAKLAHAWAEDRGYGRLAEASTHQLDLYAAGIESEFAKHESLPSILELDELTFALLRQPDDAALRTRMNRQLLNLNVRAGTLAISLLDADGKVLSSSDWYEPGSSVGRDLSGTAFFVEALRSGQARSFAANGPRGAPECYFARSIVRQDRVVAVVAVRVSLESIESTWVEYAAGTHSEKLLVIDDNGIIIMSSNAPWRYKSIAPLSLAQIDALADTGLYPMQALAPLGLQIERELAYGSRLVRVPAPPGPTGPPRYQQFVSQEQAMLRPSWRLVTLANAQPVSVDALHAALGSAALGGLVGLLGLYLLLRRRALALQHASREALQRAKDELELRVEERTAALWEANAALTVEVGERRRAEEELRETQDELVRAGRLALLGRMSAAVTHEINQPLTALRALSDNSRRLLAAGRVQDLERNMNNIAALTERLGRITAQLKSFARKAPVPSSPVQLGLSVQNALQLLRDRLEAEDIEVSLDLPEPLRVLCDSYRVEQVLVNLIANAIDAMKGCPVRRLTITARREDGRVHVRVRDTGTGLSDAVVARLFEPFFSTKPQGEGLGLGLVISSDIVKEFGGTLRARSTDEGGAEFGFDLTLGREMRPEKV